jgi:acyl dehydratase
MALYFEDLQPGRRIESGPRPLTRQDIDDFARLSGDRTALHTDEAYAASTSFGGLVAHGALVLAVATGLAYESSAFEGTVLAVRSMQLSFQRPVRPGDALTLGLTVSSREEAPRGDRGRVTLGVDVLNQDGRVVLSGSWAMVIRRRAG